MTSASPRTYVPVLLERRADEKATVVVLTGELDVAVASTLHRMLPEIPSATLPNIVVDLRRVDFIDCSAVGALVRAHRCAASVGGHVRVVGARPQPLRLLQLTGLAGVLRVRGPSDADHEGADG